MWTSELSGLWFAEIALQASVHQTSGTCSCSVEMRRSWVECSQETLWNHWSLKQDNILHFQCHETQSTVLKRADSMEMLLAVSVHMNISVSHFRLLFLHRACPIVILYKLLRGSGSASACPSVLTLVCPDWSMMRQTVPYHVRAQSPVQCSLVAPSRNQQLGANSIQTTVAWFTLIYLVRAYRRFSIRQVEWCQV